MNPILFVPRLFRHFMLNRLHQRVLIPVNRIGLACVILSMVMVLGTNLPAHAADGGYGDIRSQPTDTSLPGQVELGQGTRMLESNGLPIRPQSVRTTLNALRASAWKEGNVHRLYLDGWVKIEVGTYKFDAQRADVWIHRRETVISNADGTETPASINEIAFYLEGIRGADHASGLSTSGKNLLITTTTIGTVDLGSDTFHDSYPENGLPFLQRGESRFVNWLQLQIREPMENDSLVVDKPVTVKEVPIDMPALDEYLRRGTTNEGIPGEIDPIRNAPMGNQQPTSGGHGISPQDPGRTGYWTGGLDSNPYGATIRPDATVFFRADEIEYQFAQERNEGYAILKGNLVVQYTESTRRPGESRPRQLTLHADRAVIFTDPIESGELNTQKLDAQTVHGVYLEGNVTATDGDYSLRGPRMFYDFEANKAIVLDAVFYTYNHEARVPVYIRADEIRQVADRNWEAEDVIVSTSEFFIPSVSLGADRIAIRQHVDQSSGTGRIDVTIKHATLNVGEVPVFWWPYYKGAAEDLPLRSVGIGGNSNDGVTVKSEWNLLALMGYNPKRSGNDVSLLFDHYEDRGVGIGLDGTFRTARGKGRFDGYYISDDGTDDLSSGRKIERNGDDRGFFQGIYQARLWDDWDLISEVFYASDPAFMDSFKGGRVEASREMQSRIALRTQNGGSQFEIFGKFAVNDFVVNQDLLQAQPYQVEKLPELGYYRYGDTLFDESVSYSSEYRLSSMQFKLPGYFLSEIGQGQSGFGLPSNTNMKQYYEGLGYRESVQNRFFTRHEMSMPMQMGNFKVTPFTMARLTFYDDEEALQRIDKDAEDAWWYLQGGVRISTQFSKIDNGVDNRLFDLHRMRHIIEPSLTVWHGESNASGEDYAIYDLDVEGVSKGTAAQIGIRNTWQTQRGGPGRWRSVDVLVIDANVVIASSENQDEQEIPRFFDYRPEYSRLGDHVQSDFSWLVSDSFALTGDAVYDTNNGHFDRGNIGFRLDHATNLFTYAEYQEYQFNDDHLMNLGLGYQITPSYKVRFASNYDLDEDEFRYLVFGLSKRLPQFDMGFDATYDNERDDTTVGLVISPKGSGGRSYGGILNPRDENN